MNWEQIDNWHQRAKVHGGWLVKAFENVSHLDDQRGICDGYDYRVAMAFVPDPLHVWELDNVQPK